MNEVETIKDTLSIDTVVGRYVELKKSGVNYSGLCPFHNEKTPSFYVSPDRGTYKCFGCGEGGDIFSFVEKIEGLSFREALEKFAAETGITLSNSPAGKNTSRDKKDTLYAILEHARIYWQQQLAQNEDAIKYLKKRGFTKEQVVTFGIGYANNQWEDLKKHLLSKGVTEKLIEEAGLIKQGEKGTTYDRFRDRIIFPLRNQGGKTVAFSGRYVGSDDVSAKYLNSPETVIFNKSKELYGFDTAKNIIRKNNFVIVVEGQVDLVMGQSVYPNTVATSGTSLTRQHLESIKRFTDRIIFIFDSDQAGINAAFKASLTALDLDFEVRIVRLPQNTDPADIILNDHEQYRKLIKDAEDVYDYWITTINQGGINPREKTKLIEERLVPLLAGHGNPLEQDRYIKHTAHGVDISEDSLRSRISQLKGKQTTNPSNTNQHKETEVIQTNNSLERLALLYIWQQSLGANNQLIEVENEIMGLVDQDTRNILEKEIETQKDNDNESDFFEFEKMYENSIILQNDISELITNLSLYRTKQRQKELMQQHKIALQSGDTDRAHQLLQEIQQLLSQHG